MNNDILLSVIIPVHNGKKYIKALSSTILSQSIRNIELILVENNSIDNSYEICEQVSHFDNRVILLQSKDKGTSFARKIGIENATGKYAFLCDQDDSLINNLALANMVASIERSGADICQFSYYKDYGFGLKRKIQYVDHEIDVSGEEMRIDGIKDIFMGGRLSPNVWNKLFLTAVLKDAVKHINDSLYFGEDMFLTMCAIRSELTQKVHFDTNGYYLWKRGTGFSSTGEADKALLRDYHIIKPKMVKMFDEMNSNERVYLSMHNESLGFMKFYLFGCYKDSRKHHKKFYDEYDYVNSLDHIKIAKQYFQRMSDENRIKYNINNDLLYLSTDFSADDFLNHYEIDISQYNNSFKRWKHYQQILKKVLVQTKR